LKEVLSALYQEEIYAVPNPVIVIVPRPWHEILPDERALLAKILSSVKISIDSIMIKTVTEVSFVSLSSLKPEKILVFGVPTKPEITFYECVPVEGMSVIAADDLRKLDDGKKKNLWIALKQMFRI
jgi:hypothetical protein